MTDEAIRWVRRFTFSSIATVGPQPGTVIEQLKGIRVRCTRCKEPDVASLRRKNRWRRRPRYYTFCGNCRKDTVVGGELGAIDAVMEVAPDEVDRLFSPVA